MLSVSFSMFVDCVFGLGGGLVLLGIDVWEFGRGGARFVIMVFIASLGSISIHSQGREEERARVAGLVERFSRQDAYAGVVRVGTH